MTCSPEFPKSIPFDCVMEIISDIRNPSENWMDLLEKSSWVIGSCVSVLGKQQIFGSNVLSKTNIKTLANDVEKLIKDSEVKGFGFSIDPALVMMILQLVLKWLVSRKSRN